MTNENDLSRTAKDVPTVEVTVKYLNALRKAAALHIDPETAEVEWWYAQTLDPYGDHPDLPEECWQVGREYFARIPGTDVWILFDDLPEVTHLMLWEKHKSKLAFPAGLRRGRPPVRRVERPASIGLIGQRRPRARPGLSRPGVR